MQIKEYGVSLKLLDKDITSFSSNITLNADKDTLFYTLRAKIARGVIKNSNLGEKCLRLKLELDGKNLTLDLYLAEILISDGASCQIIAKSAPYKLQEIKPPFLSGGSDEEVLQNAQCEIKFGRLSSGGIINQDSNFADLIKIRAKNKGALAYAFKNGLKIDDEFYIKGDIKASFDDGDFIEFGITQTKNPPISRIIFGDENSGENEAIYSNASLVLNITPSPQPTSLKHGVSLIHADTIGYPGVAVGLDENNKTRQKNPVPSNEWANLKDLSPESINALGQYRMDEIENIPWQEGWSEFSDEDE